MEKKEKEELKKAIEDIKKKLAPPKEKEEEVRKQLTPLFADFYAGSPKFKLHKKYKPKFSEKTKKTLQFVTRWADIIETYTNNISESDQGKRLGYARFLEAITYLLDVELIGNAYVDQTILLLIAGDLDLHLEPDCKHRYVRHVASLEDLESPSLSLSVKLDFLHSNGLTFFSKWIDRNLRNKIAHLEFEIDDKGNFKAGNKRIDTKQKSKTFREYYLAVALIFAEEEMKAGLTE